MTQQKQSRGICEYCGKEMSKGGLSRHLNACANRAAAIEAANKKTGVAETIYHLQVSDFYLSDFWLHLEMRGNARLKELDKYLRSIWLECCGHLSEFSIGGPWSGDIVKMTRKAASVFHRGLVLEHIYDFGTTSETKIKVVSARHGKPLTKHPIALMARNHIPDSPCIVCGKHAKWLCMECVIEEEINGFLCEKHATDHPHEDYGMLEVVNSPRVGMCGDVSPAEPPY